MTETNTKPGYDCIWDNPSACDSLGVFETIEEAKSAGREWLFTTMFDRHEYDDCEPDCKCECHENGTMAEYDCETCEHIEWPYSFEVKCAGCGAEEGDCECNSDVEDEDDAPAPTFEELYAAAETWIEHDPKAAALRLLEWLGSAELPAFCEAENIGPFDPDTEE